MKNNTISVKKILPIAGVFKSPPPPRKHKSNTKLRSLGSPGLTKRFFTISTIIPLTVFALLFGGTYVQAAERIAVEVEHIRNHLQVFQKLANANGGSREAGTAGDQASRAYAVRVLKQAGFKVASQAFSFPYFQSLGASTLALVEPASGTILKTYHEWTEENPPQSTTQPTDDYRYTQYSAGTQGLLGGVIEGLIQAVDVVIPAGAASNTSSSGCETTDFAGFTAGNIALIQRGTCPFFVKVANAVAAGASGVILFNEGQVGRVDVFGTTVNEPVSMSARNCIR